MKYNVSADLTPIIPILLEIEADSEEAAFDKSLEIITKYHLTNPCNGENVELTGADVDLNYAEPVD